MHRDSPRLAGLRFGAEKPVKIDLTTDLTGIATTYTRSRINGTQLAADPVPVVKAIEKLEKYKLRKMAESQTELLWDQLK